MFDNDTGDIIDLRNSEIVEYEQIKVSKDKVWQDFWQESQVKTLELVKACKTGNVMAVELQLQS